MYGIMKGLMGNFQRKSKGFYYIAMLILMTLILQQCLNNNVEAKKLQQQQSKKTLKLFKSSSSLVQLRHKRDVFTNDQQQQQQRERESFVKDNMKYYENLDVNDDGSNDSNNDYYSDENYDVLPNVFDGNTSPPPPSLGDQISEKAKQVAESFTNMWQSLGESVKHCIQAIHALFDDDENEGVEGQENVFVMEHEYRLKPEYDNEVFANNL